MKRHPKNGGFSLIELSIALLILGLIMGPLMESYRIYRIKKMRSDTTANERLVEAAIGTFFIKNRRYPCPADRSIRPDQANYGRENCTGLAAPNCTGLNDPNGICVAAGRDADGVSGPDRVLIGSVPFQDLQLSPDVSMDAWSRSLTYAVTASQTVDTKFNVNYGAITLNTFDSTSFKAGAAVIALKENTVHFVINSAGPDGVGAYMSNGKQTTACPSLTSNPFPPDAYNCSNTATFFDGSIGGGKGSRAGAFHDDDMMVYDDKLSTGIWTYAATKAGSILSALRIGVGTDMVGRRMQADGTEAPDNTALDKSGTDLNEGSYDPDIQLDVNGTIGATTVYANELCNNAGVNANDSNCFKPSDIATSGPIKCTSGLMRGIKEVAPSNCQGSFAPTQIISCPSGKNVIGFVGGVPKCG